MCYPVDRIKDDIRIARSKNMFPILLLNPRIFNLILMSKNYDYESNSYFNIGIVVSYDIKDYMLVEQCHLSSLQEYR